jgi:hypothetical protein
MKLLYRLLSAYKAKQARNIRKRALAEYRMLMRQADKLERASNRCKRLSRGLKFASNAAPKPAKPLWLPMERKHFTEINHQLVQP